MADAFADALLGRDEGTIAPGLLDIGVIITDRALFRPDVGDTAHLEGYGPVPDEAVRAQLRAATAEPEDPSQDPFGADGPSVRAEIRRLYTHPLSGELIAMESTARAFPPAMRRFLTWRDTSCRGPHCNAAIRQSDHIDPASRGGPTSLDNGQGLCAHCNQKEIGTSSVQRIEEPDGSGHRVEWIGHSGARSVTTPTPLVWPRRRGPEDPPIAADGPERPEPPEASGVTRPRRQPARGRRRPRPRGPRPPGRSGPAATGAPEPGPDRPAPPSSRRSDRAESADDPDR